ncbi:AAA family ATPase [Angustibacter aerolatus]
MSYRVLIAAPSQELAADLAETVAAAGAQAVGTVTSEAQLREQLGALDADVVLVREDLSPTPVWPLIREAVTAKPYLAIVVAARSGSAEVLAQAMDAGARAVVELPLQVEDVATKIMSAGGWAQTMRRVIGGEREATTSAAGLMVVLAGAKGGVGTTTLAVHLALHSAQDDPTRRVCLVDLDVAKGDVPLYLDAQHRRSILDLAPVAQDLGPRAIADALYQHPSGLNVLLAPAEGEFAERLTGDQVAAILTGLRQRHDVVIVDAGAVVNEASAAAVELADEVYVVTMPDVPSLRGVRRAVEMWERLGLRKEEAVQTIVNRADKRTDIQAETAAKIAGTQVVETRLPAVFRGLEAAANQRDPELAQSGWTSKLEQLAVELRVSSQRPLSSRQQRAARPERAARERRAKGGRRRAVTTDDLATADEGQGTIELVGLFPILILIVLLAWQAVLMGVGAHYAANSAAEGARAAAVGGDVRSAAEQAVPASFRRGMQVSSSGTTVRVAVRPPLFVPGARSLDIPLRASAGQVSER